MLDLCKQLVKRIVGGTAEEKEHGVMALKSITIQDHGENCPDVINAGAVKPLVELIKSGSSDAQHAACATLAELAATTKARGSRCRRRSARQTA